MKRHDGYLQRLAPECYRGQAYVHWSVTLHDRKTGWLKPIFYYKFRELLTHSLFRYGICCPMFCCMPDHIHLLWIGILRGSDQRVAMKHFRKHLNDVLQVLGVRLQNQSYDHVLKDEERQEAGFEALADYIARNPERDSLWHTLTGQTRPTLVTAKAVSHTSRLGNAVTATSIWSILGSVMPT